MSTRGLTDFQVLNSIAIIRQFIDSHKAQIENLKEEIERYENTIKEIKRNYEQQSTKQKG